MSRTFILLSAALLALLLTVAACAEDSAVEEPEDTDATDDTDDTDEAEDEDDADDAAALRIGYAPSELDETDFFGQFQLGLETGLADLGVDYELNARAPSTAEAHNEQFDFVEDLITLDVDVIIIAPTGFEEQIASYEAVNEAGIPLFMTNFSRPAPDEEPDVDIVQYSGYSHAEGGEVLGDHFAEALEEGTQVAVLRGVPGEVDDQRALPAIERMEAAGVEVVTQEVGNFERDQAFELTQRIMAAYPDLDMIYAVNSGMAGGAVAGLEAAGFSPGEDVAVWGYGGTVEELELILEGNQTGTVFRDPVEMGMAMAESMLLVAEGRIDEITEDFNATMQLITGCEDIVERVPAIAFGGADNAPTLEDCVE